MKVINIREIKNWWNPDGSIKHLNHNIFKEKQMAHNTQQFSLIRHPLFYHSASCHPECIFLYQPMKQMLKYFTKEIDKDNHKF